MHVHIFVGNKSPLTRGQAPTLPHGQSRNLSIDYNVYYEFIVLSTEMVIVSFMKKEVIITARITPEIKERLQALADKDERTLAWMVRKLLMEALEARGLLKKQKRIRPE